MKTVLVFGTFDILHPGHTHMLKEAKEYGDRLVVVLARDATVLQVKKKPPANDEITRKKNLEALHLTDKVRLGDLVDKYKVIGEEKPDVVALGYDQREFVDKLEDVLEDNVKIVRLAPYSPDVFKSSKLRDNN